MSQVWFPERGNHARGFLSVFLWMWKMQNHFKTKERWLLCFLFLWNSKMPTCSDGKRLLLIKLLQIHQNIIAKLQAGFKSWQGFASQASKNLHPFYRRVVFFGLPLHLLPPTCGHKGIMFYCIFRRRLAGWWLVAYIHRSARFQFYSVRGLVPVFSLQLLWLQLNLGKLPF